MDIKSPTNHHFKTFKKLLSGRGIKKEGMAILSGKKQVMEAIDKIPEGITDTRLIGWITPGDNHPPPEKAEELTWYRLSTPLFREIDIYGTNFPLLLFRVPELPVWEDVETLFGLTLFIPFQDPTNVGAVIRSAAAFGVLRLVLLREAANPYHHKSIRAAGTGLFNVSLFRGPSIESLEVIEIPLFSLDPDGENISKEILPRNMGIVAGLEGPGLPQRFRQKKTISIPMTKGTESINAAAAVTVAMFEWRRRHLTR